MKEVYRKLLAFVMAYVGQHHFTFSIKELMVFYISRNIKLSTLL